MGLKRERKLNASPPQYLTVDVECTGVLALALPVVLQMEITDTGITPRWQLLTEENLGNCLGCVTRR